MIRTKQKMRPVLLGALLACMVTPVFSQDTNAEKMDSACGTGDIADAKLFMPIFEGIWSVEHLAGVVLAAGMVMPFPGDGEIENIELKLADGWLEAHHPEMQSPMIIGFANETPFAFAQEDLTNGLPIPGISRESIETEAGCDITDLPNLLGDAEVTVNGVVMRFTWRMWPIDANNITVVQHTTSFVQGIEMITRRSVRMMRM